MLRSVTKIGMRRGPGRGRLASIVSENRGDGDMGKVEVDRAALLAGADRPLISVPASQPSAVPTRVRAMSMQTRGSIQPVKQGLRKRGNTSSARVPAVKRRPRHLELTSLYETCRCIALKSLLCFVCFRCNFYYSTPTRLVNKPLRQPAIPSRSRESIFIFQMSILCECRLRSST